MPLKFSVMLATVSAFGLTACVESGGDHSKAQTGAVAGAMIGGLLGGTRKGDDKLAKAATGAETPENAMAQAETAMKAIWEKWKDKGLI